MCELVGCSSKGQGGRPSRGRERGWGRAAQPGSLLLYVLWVTQANLSL